MLLEPQGVIGKMFGEDIDLWMRMAARHPVAYSPVPTAVWHVDAGNRRCVQQGQSANLYNPDSLGASLAQIQSDITIPSEVKNEPPITWQSAKRRPLLPPCWQASRHMRYTSTACGERSFVADPL